MHAVKLKQSSPVYAKVMKLIVLIFDTCSGNVSIALSVIITTSNVLETACNVQAHSIHTPHVAVGNSTILKP